MGVTSKLLTANRFGLFCKKPTTVPTTDTTFATCSKTLLKQEW